jgi:hypothetical protein
VCSGGAVISPGSGNERCAVVGDDRAWSCKSF